MMRKVYTAHEMRVLADRIWDYETMSKGLELCDNELELVDCEATHDLIHMLRQAAGMIEREKKYEYAHKYGEDVIAVNHTDDAKNALCQWAL